MDEERNKRVRDLRVEQVGDGELERCEPIYERLDLPEEALGNLAMLGALDERWLSTESGWAARVRLDDTLLYVRGDGARWSILAPPGADESECALAARVLHGMLGGIGEGWDLDR